MRTNLKGIDGGNAISGVYPLAIRELKSREDGCGFTPDSAEGNIQFGQHEDMRQFLLDTGNAVIVEASPRDRIWGIGMSASNENARNPAKWRGQNLLGFTLMYGREDMRR